MWDLVAQHIFLALTLLLSLGGAGALIAIVALGIPAALLLARAGGILQSAIEFLKTPVGQAVAVGVIVAASFIVGDVHRTRVDAAREKAAEIARTERENALRQSIAAEAAARVAEIQKQTDALQTQVTAYEQTLARENSAACRATGADVRELRKF